MTLIEQVTITNLCRRDRRFMLTTGSYDHYFWLLPGESYTTHYAGWHSIKVCQDGHWHNAKRYGMVEYDGGVISRSGRNAS